MTGRDLKSPAALGAVTDRAHRTRMLLRDQEHQATAPVQSGDLASGSSWASVGPAMTRGSAILTAMKRPSAMPSATENSDHTKTTTKIVSIIFRPPRNQSVRHTRCRERPTVREGILSTESSSELSTLGGRRNSPACEPDTGAPDKFPHPQLRPRGD